MEVTSPKEQLHAVFPDCRNHEGGQGAKEGGTGGASTALNIIESGQVAADDSDQQATLKEFHMIGCFGGGEGQVGQSNGAMLDPVPRHPNSSCRKETHRPGRPHPTRHPPRRLKKL